ncbi:hypothetical protein LSG31_06190 [Fodinisporobacter ferrooxydans]|uniref:DUF2759 domain-containing protein n=1 Tax=Fodinisporobacter ferrooxydans TaxID=2901836 RepID=A0ABY4CMW5_9BACL|nr:hypothetical protein LSG31_06190 [Alicyclobacillaceae bacterium MYW30-H2]
MYLHPVLIGVFLVVFAVLAIIGGIRLFKQKHYAMAVFLLITMVVFGFSGFTALTLHV